MSEAAAVSEQEHISLSDIALTMTQTEKCEQDILQQLDHLLIQHSLVDFRSFKASCEEIDMGALHDFDDNGSDVKVSLEEEETRDSSSTKEHPNQGISYGEKQSDRVTSSEENVETPETLKVDLYQSIQQIDQEQTTQISGMPTEEVLSQVDEGVFTVEVNEGVNNETPSMEEENENGIQENTQEPELQAQLLVEQQEEEIVGEVKLNFSEIDEEQIQNTQQTFSQNPFDDITESFEEQNQRLDKPSANESLKQTQDTTDSKIKKLVDDFFHQVETEASSKASQKRKTLQPGKENTPTNIQSDSLETPKCKTVTSQDESLLLSPLKKHQLSSNSSDSDISPAYQDQEESSQFELKPQEIQSPGKQEPVQEAKKEDEGQQEASASVQEKIQEQIRIEDKSSQAVKQEQHIKIEEAAESADTLTKEQELTKKQQELQKEKEALRAPFSDLMNASKKRDSQTIRESISRKSRVVDVNKVIFVDSYILNYSSFFPGKLLGSTLNVGNITNAEQIVELSIDSNSFQYNKKQINEKFGNPELPFVLDSEQIENGKKTENIVNSEIKHESWFIENPISKELTKRITLKLGPKAEQDFIIVVRSPNAKKTENLLSIINIGVLTYADEQFGVKDSFEDFLKQKYNNSMKEFLRDRKKLAQQQRVEILLAGKVDVPSLICQKELVVTEHNEKVIPLVVKKGQACQKFRVPFKNNGPQDLEIDFTFAKQSAVINGPALQRSNSGEAEDSTNKNSVVQTSPIEFVSMPSNVKIPANGTTILNIAAKLRNSYQLASLKEEKTSLFPKPEKYNHLLIAKIKDTQIMFSYIIEASVIESSGSANAMS